MDTDTIETDDAPAGMDMEAAADQIGASLFPETEDSTDDTAPTEKAAEAVARAPVDTGKSVAAQQEAVTEATPAPRSFRADLKHVWEKIPSEAQQYYLKREQDMIEGTKQYAERAQYGHKMYESVKPFEHILREQGVDAPQAVNTLLRAHQRLTTGTPESRRQAYEELGQRLQLAPAASPTDTQPQVDPRIHSLEQRQQQIERYYQQQAEARHQENLTRINQEVDAFAKDAAHPFFDECLDDIEVLVKAGLPLQEAYDKAVWANQVTREKQVQARFLTETEKARERARLDALPKQKARGVNVNGKETRRTPTESLGNIEDTIRSTYKTIKARTVH